MANEANAPKDILISILKAAAKPYEEEDKLAASEGKPFTTTKQEFKRGGMKTVDLSKFYLAKVRFCFFLCVIFATRPGYSSDCGVRRLARDSKNTLA